MNDTTLGRPHARAEAPGDLRWRPWFVVTATLCLVHLWRIGGYSLWFDELYSVSSASEPSLARAFEAWYVTDVHPPLYNALLFGLGRLFGHSELVMRLPSWTFVTAACVWLSCQRLTARPVTGPLAGAVLASLPLAFVYSQEARSYALLLLFTAIATTGYVHMERDRRLPATLLVGTVLASWTHMFGLAFGGLLLLMAFVHRLRAGATGDLVRIATAGLLCWAWLLYLTATGRLAMLEQAFWAGWSLSVPLLIFLHASSFTAAFAAAALLLAARPRHLHDSALWTLGLPVAAFLALIGLVSAFRFLLVGRYFIVLAPAVAIITADLIDRAWDALQVRLTPTRRAAIVAAVVVMATVENLAWMSRQKWGPYQNYRGVAAFIAADAASVRGTTPLAVILSPLEPKYEIRQIELYYLTTMLATDLGVQVQIADADDFDAAARDARYLIAMHTPDRVAQARAFVARTATFAEVDIPSSHRAMTFLARRTP